MIIVALDPGLEGALACLRDNKPLAVHDLPTIQVAKKRYLNVAEITEHLRSYHQMATTQQTTLYVAIEKQQAMPPSVQGRTQGTASSFRTGYNAGILEGIVAALRLRYELVHPTRWKRALLADLPKDKGSSIIAAQRLFPTVPFTRKKDHNRADALLLAEYTRRYVAL